MFSCKEQETCLPALDDEYSKDNDYLPDKCSTTQLLESWKKGQKHLDLFWKIWREEYLLSLREKLPIVHKGLSSTYMTVPKQGDIVLIKDDNMARSRWKLGKILHLRAGLDREIRSAEILLPNRMVITRAVNFLYPLELLTLQEENIHNQEWDGKNKQEKRAFEDIAESVMVLMRVL